MTKRMIDRMRGLEGVTFHRGASAGLNAGGEHQYPHLLPHAHRELLEDSNGIEVYGGFLRLFGLDADDAINAIQWNRADYWKFSWRDRCSSYWCFAETGWGDQYAYLLGDEDHERVYFLDAYSMSAEPIAESFSEFFENELLRCAVQPYDDMMAMARQRFGPLDSMSHLVYVPSILLGGIEAVERLEKMDARSAMICNGDVATQLDEASSSRTITGMDAYEDELGRPRVRLIWE